MSVKRRITSNSVVLFAGLAIGLSGSVATAALAGGLPQAPHGPGHTAWQKNARGMTFGSALRATTPQDEPDLIQVDATNGVTGYALRTDLEPADPPNPAAAVAYQLAVAGKSTLVPVFASDGTTKVGVFVIDHAGLSRQSSQSK